MQDFQTMDLDSMMKDIIDIFNLDGVELVRLSGLLKREISISNCQSLDADMLDRIIHKLKMQKIINYLYILKCPYCGEISYQIKNRERLNQAKVCDTCKNIYIPSIEDSLFEVQLNVLNKGVDDGNIE